MSNDYEDSVQDQNLEIIEKLWKNYKNKKKDWIVR